MTRNFGFCFNFSEGFMNNIDQKAIILHYRVCVVIVFVVVVGDYTPCFFFSSSLLQTTFASIILSNDFRFAVLMSDEKPFFSKTGHFKKSIYRAFGRELSRLYAYLDWLGSNILSIAYGKACNLSKNCCYCLTFNPQIKIDFILTMLPITPILAARKTNNISFGEYLCVWVSVWQRHDFGVNLTLPKRFNEHFLFFFNA